jgi:hypothetical protein
VTFWSWQGRQEKLVDVIGGDGIQVDTTQGGSMDKNNEKEALTNRMVDIEKEAFQILNTLGRNDPGFVRLGREHVVRFFQIKEIDESSDVPFFEEALEALANNWPLRGH